MSTAGSFLLFNACKMTHFVNRPQLKSTESCNTAPLYNIKKKKKNPVICLQFRVIELIKLRYFPAEIPN